MKMHKESVSQAVRPHHGGLGGARGLRGPTVTVLHIDDDPNDTELLRAATRKAQVDFILHNVEDGDRAMAYLSGTGAYADRDQYQLPSLILLDLKMPRGTGFEILKWIRKHPKLEDIPVVVLSGSQLKSDIERAYQVGANSYVVKPMGFEALVNFVKDINTAWLAAV
jgi:CheY-like chemotaxis protein